MQKLDGKNVVITGAASGLGRSLAMVLARKGCRIGIADINTAGAEETLKIVKNSGGSGEIFKVDVSQAEEVEAMAAYFFGAWGSVDLLVNNAGVAVVGLIGDISLENWRWIFGINFWGMQHGCHFFIPRMKAQGHGFILNVASAAGLLSSGEMSPYNTSKAAIVSLSDTLKEELAPNNIGVTVLCPMFFKTNLTDSMRYTDKFELEVTQTAFNSARISSDKVAQMAIKAVEKGNLYCVPQLSGRILWAMKRNNPGRHHTFNAFLRKNNWARPLVMWLARNGLF